MIINGSDLFMWISTELVAYSTSYSLNIEMETRPGTNKGSGIYRKALPGMLNISGSVDGLYVFAGGYATLFGRMIDRTPVRLRFGRKDSVTGQVDTTVDFMSADFLITSLELNATDAENATYTASFVYYDGFGSVSGITAPTVITDFASLPTTTTITMNGNVTSDGGAVVTDRGFVWNTGGNPTLANNYISEGSGSGVYSKLVTGLIPGVLYYYRAYAINEAGTSYGFQSTFSTTADSSVMFASPLGNDTTGTGTFTNPWHSLEKAWATLVAGDTLYMRGGTYEYGTRQDLNGKSGNAGNLIKIFAFPGEIPIITKKSTYNVAVQGQLILIDADYIHIKGLEITGFPQVLGNRAWSPIQCTTTSHSIFELLNVHHNGMGMIIELESDDNLILNCDFHHNYDVYGRTPYDGSSYAYNDGDGLVVREMPVGYNNTIRGCRSWNNADDGFDVWGGDGYITFDGCWAWMNGYREDGATTGGDGAGFKMGATTTLDDTVFARTVQNCVAFDNRQFGITQNGALCKHYIYNNTIFRNLYRGIYFSTTWGDSFHVLTNNIAYANTTNYMGPPNTILTTNSWQNGLTLSNDDFVSISTLGMDGARQSSGALPITTFLHLKTGSDLIVAGTNVSLTTDCDGVDWEDPPSIGAYEYV